jgi:hypothetical protein
MPLPTNQQVVEALAAKNIAFECRSCGSASSLKMDIAGLNLTSLGAGTTNAQVTSVRWSPMALVICGACGETRFYQLEGLGFKPPF